MHCSNGASSLSVETVGQLEGEFGRQDASLADTFVQRLGQSKTLERQDADDHKSH